MPKIFPLLLLLTACIQAPKIPADTTVEHASLSTAQVNAAFSMPEIGAYSTLKAPKNIEIIPSSRFVESQEPIFAQRIGNEIGTFEFEDFCESGQASLRLEDDIIMHCKLIETESPHIEFYFAQYNIYADDYFLLGKYALFKTYSKIYPALLVWLPKTPSAEIDFSSREAVLEFLENSRKDQEEKTFDAFVRSIVVEPLQQESEWLTYSDNNLHFSMDFPKGMGEPHAIVYGTGVTIGVDGYYSLTLHKNREEVDEYVAPGTQFKDRIVTRNVVKAGGHDAEEIVYTIPSYGLSFHYIVIPSKYGYFVFGYQPLTEEDPYVPHMLSSFRILE